MQQLPITLRVILFSVLIFSLLYSSDASLRDDVNIPHDLHDARRQLHRLLSAEQIRHIKSMNTEDEMGEYHFSFGLDIRNSWGLLKGSRLANYFNRLGVYDPDEMSDIIFSSLWCELHHKRFKISQKVHNYKKYSQAMKKPKGYSPRDGARIVWVITQGSDTEKVHLGISVSDNSYWRYTYPGRHGIEPANEEDTKKLDKLRKDWAELGTKLEDFTTDD